MHTDEVREPGSNAPPASGSRARYLNSDKNLPVGPSEAARKLFAWIWQYFDVAANAAQASQHMPNVHGLEHGPKVVLTNAPPVFVQHQGHSRTIIGIVRRRKVAGKAIPSLSNALRGGGRGGGRNTSSRGRSSSRRGRARGGKDGSNAAPVRGGGKGGAENANRAIDGARKVTEFFMGASGTAVHGPDREHRGGAQQQAQLDTFADASNATDVISLGQEVDECGACVDVTDDVWCGTWHGSTDLAPVPLVSVGAQHVFGNTKKRSAANLDHERPGEVQAPCPRPKKYAAAIPESDLHDEGDCLPVDVWDDDDSDEEPHAHNNNHTSSHFQSACADVSVPCFPQHSERTVMCSEDQNTRHHMPARLGNATSCSPLHSAHDPSADLHVARNTNTGTAVGGCNAHAYEASSQSDRRDHMLQGRSLDNLPDHACARHQTMPSYSVKQAQHNEDSDVEELGSCQATFAGTGQTDTLGCETVEHLRGGAPSGGTKTSVVTRTVQAYSSATESADEWEDVLLVLDSQSSYQKLADALTNRKGWRAHLERDSTTWRKPCYQIMTVGGLLSAEARARSKRLMSQRL